MAQTNRPYGKDNPERFISSALTGGSGDSNEIVEKKIDRPNQSINTAFAMDNVKLAMPITTSIKEDGGHPWAGGVDNLKHSLTGASAVDGKDVGAAGKTRSTIFPDH
jgi:hypothetical protein